MRHIATFGCSQISMGRFSTLLGRQRKKGVARVESLSLVVLGDEIVGRRGRSSSGSGDGMQVY